MTQTYSKAVFFAVAAALIALLPAELEAQTKYPKPPPPKTPPSKCLDLVIGGVKVARKGEGIFHPNGKGQCITLKSKNCRAITTGIWIKNLCCYDDIWVRLRGTGSDRFFDVRYQFEDKNVSGAVARGNFNVVVEPCRIIDGRVRVSCVRGKVRAKRKLKKLLIRGFVVGDPADRDGLKVKGKFL